MLYMLKVPMGCGAAEANTAAPMPELRLRSGAGVRVDSWACPHARLDQPFSFLLLSLILLWWGFVPKKPQALQRNGSQASAEQTGRKPDRNK